MNAEVNQHAVGEMKRFVTLFLPAVIVAQLHPLLEAVCIAVMLAYAAKMFSRLMGLPSAVVATLTLAATGVGVAVALNWVMR